MIYHCDQLGIVVHLVDVMNMKNYGVRQMDKIWRVTIVDCIQKSDQVDAD